MCLKTRWERSPLSRQGTRQAGVGRSKAGIHQAMEYWAAVLVFIRERGFAGRKHPWAGRIPPLPQNPQWILEQAGLKVWALHGVPQRSSSNLSLSPPRFLPRQRFLLIVHVCRYWGGGVLVVCREFLCFPLKSSVGLEGLPPGTEFSLPVGAFCSLELLGPFGGIKPPEEPPFSP